MKKYRKKPVVVEAAQWFKMGDVSEAEIKMYLQLEDRVIKDCSGCKKDLNEHGLCSTLEGEYIVCPGDYIIKGIKGEYYPCKPDIFAATYEEVK